MRRTRTAFPLRLVTGLWANGGFVHAAELLGVSLSRYIDRILVGGKILSYPRKFWHQFLRQPFSAVSSFVTRDVLGLPRPSLLERYTNVFIVFLASGFLHVVIDLAQCVPVRYSGSLHYWLSFVLGIMIEDGGQALFERLSPSGVSSGKTDTGPSLWRRAVGWLWVMGWIGVFSTQYLHPLGQTPQDEFALVPLSVAKYIGFEPLVGIVVISGIVIGVLFQAEV